MKRSNAVILLMAGRRFSPWVVLEHAGRRSGRTYRTPLVTFRHGDGFVFILAYGNSVDWCRNVLASGHAVLIRKGQRIRLDRPEVIAVDETVRSAIPASARSMTADQALWLHRQVGPADRS
jgi:deazaflavin-dependent oxidoreductase (nitroreductase family)